MEINADSERKKLNKLLYNAARALVDKRYQDDPEAVKAKRDQFTYEMFNKRYSQLNRRQLEICVSKLERLAGRKPNVKVLASKQQIKLLRFYGVACALHYYDFSHLMYVDELGNPHSGEECRYKIKGMFNAHAGEIPDTIFRAIYQNWINPKCHDYLMEGGFKKYVRNREYMNYAELQDQEAAYLINRFRAMYNNIEMPMDHGDMAEFIHGN